MDSYYDDLIDPSVLLARPRLKLWQALALGIAPLALLLGTVQPSLAGNYILESKSGEELYATTDNKTFVSWETETKPRLRYTALCFTDEPIKAMAFNKAYTKVLSTWFVYRNDAFREARLLCSRLVPPPIADEPLSAPRSTRASVLGDKK